MSDDAKRPEDTFKPCSGSKGTEGVWADIDRSYDVEHLHNLRQVKINQRNISFAAQQLRSQMLGLMLVGEADLPLVPGGTCEEQAAEGEPTADPT